MKKQINKKIIAYSLIGIIFVILGFVVNWLWFAGAVIVIWLNQRELMKIK